MGCHADAKRRGGEGNLSMTSSCPNQVELLLGTSPDACEDLGTHPLTPECLRIQYAQGAVAELADAGDLKSSEGNLVWVRLPLAPLIQVLNCRTRNPIL